MDLVIFHRDCPDGWCAAFIAQKRYPGVQLLGKSHGEPVPYEEVSGKDVLVVDFSWRTKEINRELNERAKSFQILDHHKSAFEILSGEPYATFDMDRSGAGLTFDSLFTHAQRPWYVDYVEDHDLWRHKLYESRTVSAYVMTLPHTIEAWNELDHTDIDEAIRFGQGASLQIKHYVEKAIGQRQMGVLQEHVGTYNGPRVCSIVNAPYMNCSEVGEALTAFAPIGLTWFERGDGVIQFSLRSEGDVDVSAIAKLYGGGGHLHAAGFQLPYKEGRKVIDGALYRDFV